MKDFVPYQEALALRELGFNKPCFGNWQDMKEANPWLSNSYTISQDQYYGQLCSAPTYSQAFRWFREKHELNAISPTRIYKTDFYQARIVNWNNWEEINIKQCDSYEEAELACLRRLIEIVKNKEI